MVKLIFIEELGHKYFSITRPHTGIGKRAQMAVDSAGRGYSD